MKYKGQKLEGPAEDYIVFPRRNGDVVFCVRAILNYDECDKLDPKPEPPMRLLPGGQSGRQQANVEDPKYKKALDDWAARRTHYMVIKSLEPSEDIEWEQVKMEDPSTWELAEKELTEAGFTAAEVMMLIRKIMEVNGLDEEKIKEATESFLAGQVDMQKMSTSQNSEQNGTPSGEPAND